MFCAKPTKWSLLIAVLIGIAANETVFAAGGFLDTYGMDDPHSGFRYPSDNLQLHANLNRSGNVPVSSLVGLSNSASPLRDRDEIVLFNPSENSRDAQYLLNGTPYIMQPGTMQRLKNDRVWKVAVNTETGRVLPYTLGSGVYKFKPTGIQMSMGLFATQDRPGMSAVAVPTATALSGRQGPSSGIPVTVPPAPLPMSDYAAHAEQRLVYRNLERHSSDHPGPMISASQWFNTGRSPTLEQFRGKVILLDFWGSWCGPCVRNLPKVQSLYQRYKDRGLVVVGVHSAQGAESVAAFLTSRPLSFPIAIDTGATAERYGVESWPTYFLIDKSGQLRRGFGHEPPSEQQIEFLLN